MSYGRTQARGQRLTSPYPLGGSQAEGRPGALLSASSAGGEIVPDRTKVSQPIHRFLNGQELRRVYVVRGRNPTRS